MLQVARLDGGFQEQTTVAGIYSLARRKIDLVRVISALPGHKEKAGYAARHVLGEAAQELREVTHSRPKESIHLARRALWHLAPHDERGYSWARGLCQAGALESLAGALAPAGLSDASSLVLDKAAVGAQAMGHDSRLSWYIRRKAGEKGIRSFSPEQMALRAAMSGELEQALTLVDRAMAAETDSARKRRQADLRCVVLARAGRDDPGATTTRSPWCAAVRAWGLALAGRPHKALEIWREVDAGETTRGNVSDRFMLLRLALLAEAGQWSRLEQFWKTQRGNQYRFGDHRNLLYEVFNDINNRPIPLSLTHRLQLRIEQRLLAGAGGAGPLLQELL